MKKGRLKIVSIAIIETILLGTTTTPVFAFSSVHAGGGVHVTPHTSPVHTTGGVHSTGGTHVSGGNTHVNSIHTPSPKTSTEHISPSKSLGATGSTIRANSNTAKISSAKASTRGYSSKITNPSTKSFIDDEAKTNSNSVIRSSQLQGTYRDASSPQKVAETADEVINRNHYSNNSSNDFWRMYYNYWLWNTIFINNERRTHDNINLYAPVKLPKAYVSYKDLNVKGKFGEDVEIKFDVKNKNNYPVEYFVTPYNAINDYEGKLSYVKSDEYNRKNTAFRTFLKDKSKQHFVIKGHESKSVKFKLFVPKKYNVDEIIGGFLITGKPKKQTDYRKFKVVTGYKPIHVVFNDKVKASLKAEKIGIVLGKDRNYFNLTLQKNGLDFRNGSLLINLVDSNGTILQHKLLQNTDLVPNTNINMPIQVKGLCKLKKGCSLQIYELSSGDSQKSSATKIAINDSDLAKAKTKMKKLDQQKSPTKSKKRFFSNWTIAIITVLVLVLIVLLFTLISSFLA